jgi:AcrR family transcriptional regulator
MGRTRSALLGATAECVARYGIRKTTMVDVASKSGVAKATLYNHFRTKDDVLAAVVEQQVADLVGACVTTASSSGLVDALVHTANVLAAHPALRKAAEDEQALLAPLMTPTAGRGWQLARDGVAAVLTAGGGPSTPADVDTVLRWCTSQVLWPLAPDSARPAAEALVRGLSGRPAPVATPAAPASERSAALGWPA